MDFFNSLFKERFDTYNGISISLYVSKLIQIRPYV